MPDLIPSSRSVPLPSCKVCAKVYARRLAPDALPGLLTDAPSPSCLGLRVVPCSQSCQWVQSCARRIAHLLGFNARCHMMLLLTVQARIHARDHGTISGRVVYNALMMMHAGSCNIVDIGGTSPKHLVPPTSLDLGLSCVLSKRRGQHIA